MKRPSVVPNGTLVLDREGLAKATLRDPEMNEGLAAARARDKRVLTGAATLVEVAQPGIKRAALQWTLLRITVEPVTGAIAREAAVLLRDARLHGHKHAIDAMSAATALAAQPPVMIPASDPQDIRVLCNGRRVSVIEI